MIADGKTAKELAEQLRSIYEMLETKGRVDQSSISCRVWLRRAAEYLENEKP